MIWADRLVLMWAIFLISAIFLVFGDSAIETIHWDNVFLRTILFPWFILRVGDFIFHRRLAR